MHEYNICVFVAFYFNKDFQNDNFVFSKFVIKTDYY